MRGPITNANGIVPGIVFFHTSHRSSIGLSVHAPDSDALIGNADSCSAYLNLILLAVS